MMERLQKLLAQAGIASRRRAEEMILEGRVRVNDKVVTELGAQADPENDTILVDNQPVSLETKAYYVLNKPRGYISDRDDTAENKTALDLVPDGRRLFSAGRLDLMSEGMLLLTNDGELANRLTHPRYEHEKEYLALVYGMPDDKVYDRLVRGILYDGEWLRADSADHAGKSQVYGEAGRDETWIRLILHEGKKRQIRHMCAALGHPVKRLIRVRIGPLELGNLKTGEWRKLTKDEVALLREKAQPREKRPLGSARGKLPTTDDGRRRTDGARATRDERRRTNDEGRSTAVRPSRGTRPTGGERRGGAGYSRGDGTKAGAGSFRRERGDARDNRREQGSGARDGSNFGRGGSADRRGRPDDRRDESKFSRERGESREGRAGERRNAPPSNRGRGEGREGRAGERRNAPQSNRGRGEGREGRAGDGRGVSKYSRERGESREGRGGERRSAPQSNRGRGEGREGRAGDTRGGAKFSRERGQGREGRTGDRQDARKFERERGEGRERRPEGAREGGNFKRDYAKSGGKGKDAPHRDYGKQGEGRSARPSNRGFQKREGTGDARNREDRRQEGERGAPRGEYRKPQGEARGPRQGYAQRGASGPKRGNAPRDARGPKQGDAKRENKKQNYKPRNK